MTCIVAVVSDGTIHMAADSATTDGWGTQDRLATSKVFRSGDMLFGCSGSSRLAQILQYVFRPPRHVKDVEEDQVIERETTAFLVTEVVPALRGALDHEDALVTRDNTAALLGNSSFLLGYRGHLYTVCSDFQVHENTDNFAATGSGSEVAVGALYASGHLAPRERLEQALEAACRYNAYCRPPYTFQTLEAAAQS